ncbi:MAG: hypothetical protein N2111_13305 [Candidatus Sumerlaeaceae bacterium]|nr:hypothetical protein [Candidatus Sumerlaeaceae bacterium]
MRAHRGLLVALLALASAVAGAFTVPWGTAPENLGLRTGPEIEPSGPLTFTVSPSGSIIVADSVNRCVKEFSSEGKYLRTLAVDVVPSSLTHDASGRLLMLEGRRVLTPGENGKVAEVLTVPESVPLVEGYGQDVLAENGRIGVNDPDEYVYLFDPKDPQPLEPAAVRLGRRAPGGRAFTVIKGFNDASIRLAADSPAQTRASGRTLVLVAGSGPSGRLGVVAYRGADKSGANYVEVERISGRQVQLFVERYGGDGKASIELPNNYFTTVYRKFEVQPDGSVWQMLTTPAGVEFTRREVK